jgi:hypothetical protein
MEASSVMSLDVCWYRSLDVKIEPAPPLVTTVQLGIATGVGVLALSLKSQYFPPCQLSIFRCRLVPADEVCS